MYLVAVSAVAVNLGRDGDNFVAVDVGVTARTEADLEPSALNEVMR